MVTTEVSQLSNECNAWRETLRSYREQFGLMKQKLQNLAATQSSKEDLLQLEHLDNQLHIQLINIHDLKQNIKGHERAIQQDLDSIAARISEETFAIHENLMDEYHSLEQTLKELMQEFELFTTRTS